MIKTKNIGCKSKKNGALKPIKAKDKKCGFLLHAVLPPQKAHVPTV